MLDSQIGLWRVLSQSFPHKAYSYLSIPVPALANKANAYLSNLLGVGAFNFFPSPSSLSIKVLIRPAFHLSIHEAIITQSKPRRKCVFFFHRAKKAYQTKAPPWLSYLAPSKAEKGNLFRNRVWGVLGSLITQGCIPCIKKRSKFYIRKFS